LGIIDQHGTIQIWTAVYDAVPERRDVAGQRPVRQRGQSLHRGMRIRRLHRPGIATNHQACGPADSLHLTGHQRRSLFRQRISSEFQAGRAGVENNDTANGS
jgi:hypothetical protein